MGFEIRYDLLRSASPLEPGQEPRLFRFYTRRNEANIRCRCRGHRGFFGTLPLSERTIDKWEERGYHRITWKRPMTKMISAEHILKLLSEKKPELERRFGVRRIGLYGSFATGTPNERSDIDILVELKEPRFDHLAGLQVYLEEALGRKVDIRRISANIRTRFAQRVEKEAVYA